MLSFSIEHSAENMESQCGKIGSNPKKKVIYNLVQNLMEFGLFWMNKSKIGQFTSSNSYMDALCEYESMFKNSENMNFISRAAPTL